MKPSFDWKLLFAALLSVVTMILVLCATSCSTSRRLEASSQHASVEAVVRADSLQTAATARQTTLLTYQPVPADSLSMRIPLTSLRDLPAGAGYSQRKGRANLTLRVQHDTLYVNASCDSLQRLVSLYERRDSIYRRMLAEYATAQRTDERREKMVEKPPNYLPAFFGLLLILGVGLFCYSQPITQLILKIFKNKNNGRNFNAP